MPTIITTISEWIWRGPAVPPVTLTEERALLAHYATCGPRARAVLLRHAARLAAGHAQYGDFAQVRDLGAETIEELVDAAIYLERWAVEVREREHAR